MHEIDLIWQNVFQSQGNQLQDPVHFDTISISSFGNMFVILSYGHK